MNKRMNNQTELLTAAVVAAGLLFAGAAFAQPASHQAQPAPASQPAAPAHAMNWFGGPIYTGQPSLQATAALVKAGGGAENFSFHKALVSMLGQKTVDAEVAKLSKQYGAKNVNDFIQGMDFAVNSSLKHATAAGIKLPAAPADLKGTKLAETLVHAGTAPDGIFWSGWLFDNALSNTIHVQVMADIDLKHGHGYDENTHRILNQAMYDVAQALKIDGVKLAPLH
ncbi:MAG: hypothetical protein ABIP44_10375 [Pseudoxanthomonas sp.]